MNYVSFKRKGTSYKTGALSLEFSKMALNPFCDETRHN